MYEVGWGVERLLEVGGEGFVCLLRWGQWDIRFKAPWALTNHMRVVLGFQKAFADN